MPSPTPTPRSASASAAPAPSPAPTALAGAADKEQLANGSFGLNDRATPTPCHRKGQAKEFQPAPGAPPPWPGFQPQTKLSNLPRNLPVKRYDGDPLGRADVQHALLCHLFADTRRVFTNPRPGERGRPGQGASTGSTAGVSTPVWPYGMSTGCLRRSDETPEEFEEWKTRKARFDKWKRRMEKKERAARSAEEKKDGEADTAESANKQNGEEEDELAAADAKDEEPGNGDGADDEDDTDEPLDENEFAKPGSQLLTFKELYIEALLNSGKCTKSMRDKIIADEEYAEDFAKVCLLVNVGRINTTLAFYPEMKTVLRSYHPLPSVQNNENTRRNMQDAPRMKSLLKAVLLENERPGAPTAGPSAGQPAKQPKVNALSEEAPGDMKEVIKRYRDGTRPPTSVVTLIFLLSLHANEISSSHFPAPHDSHSLFYPHADYPLSSKQRAHAFLWLLYHYLEGPATKPPGEQDNPFEDDRSKEATKQAREAWETLSDEEKAKQRTQPWKGLVNPEWTVWKAEDDKRKEAAEAAAASGTGTVVKEEKPADADGDVSMKDAEEGSGEEAPLGEEPPSHTHRQLVPALDVISYEQAARENMDTEEEIKWGKQMQSERAAFLAKFQEEEAAKAAAGNTAGASPAPSSGAVGKGKKGGAGGGAGGVGGGGSGLKREDIDRGTPSDADGSMAWSRAGKRRAAASGGGDASKRWRGTPLGYEDSVDGSAMDMEGGAGGRRVRPSLWDLDLSVSRHEQQESLAQVAWTRILDRAQRGVGDACYESDEEEFAEEEAAAGERTRGEICRILKSLREVVRPDVFDVNGSEAGGGEEEDEGAARNGNGNGTPVAV